MKANYQLGLLLARMGRKEEADKQLELAKSLREEDEATSRLQLRLLEPEPMKGRRSLRAGRSLLSSATARATEDSLGPGASEQPPVAPASQKPGDAPASVASSRRPSSAIPAIPSCTSRWAWRTGTGTTTRAR